MLFDIVVG
jgi:hypothetical protein